MDYCPVCKAQLEPGSSVCSRCESHDFTSPDQNPYAAGKAVITDSAPVYTPELDEGKYNIKFGVGETLEATFRAWQDSIGPLILINLIPSLLSLVVVIVGVAVAAASFLSSGIITDVLNGDFDVDRMTSMWQSMGVGAILMILFFFLLIMLFYIPSFAGQFMILDEKSRTGSFTTGIWATYGRGFRCVLPLLGFFVLIYVVMLVLMFPVGLLMAVHPALGGIGMMALVIVYVMVMVRLVPFVPFLAIERLSLFKAIARSGKLTAGYNGRVFWISVVFMIVMLGVGLMVGLVSLVPLFGQLVNFVFQLAVIPLQAAFMFAIYAGLKDIKQNEIQL